MIHTKEAETAPLSTDGNAEGNIVGLTCAKQGRLGLVTINQQKSRNAITSDMRQTLIAAYREWVEDPDIYAVIIESADPDWFSSGSDLKELYALLEKSEQQALDLFQSEYETIWTIECYTKPVIAMINGTNMGGGVGISQYGTHIIAGENYAWSMPEVKIGFFPDVAATRLLANMPGAIGTYLGLTGRSVNRDDAVYLGLLEHCIDHHHFETIKDAMREAEPVDRYLDDMNQQPGQSNIASMEPVITGIFGKPTIEEIIQALKNLEGEHKEWATSVLAELTTYSPTSLKVTLEAIRRAKTMLFEETLQQDFQLVSHFLKNGDFKSAIKARMIDKTEPAWQPANLAEVTNEILSGYFNNISVKNLDLTPRELGVDK